MSGKLYAHYLPAEKNRNGKADVFLQLRKVEELWGSWNYTILEMGYIIHTDD
jgi:hypothetical protein